MRRTNFSVTTTFTQAPSLADSAAPTSNFLANPATKTAPRPSREHGPCAVLVLSGELDLATSSELQAAVADCLARSCTTIEIDLSGLAFVDVAGLEALLNCGSRAAAAGSPLHVVRPNPRVHKVITLAGLTNVLNASRR